MGDPESTRSVERRLRCDKTVYANFWSGRIEARIYAGLSLAPDRADDLPKQMRTVEA